MKKDIAKLWIKALRSGKYKKGTGRLRSISGDKFCCLGVLCNLHAQAHPEAAATQEYPGRYFGSSSHLPTNVKNWAGMKTIHGGIYTLGLTTSLSAKNDTGTSFRILANLIEKHVDVI